MIGLVIAIRFARWAREQIGNMRLDVAALHGRLTELEERVATIALERRIERRRAERPVA